MDKGMLIVIDGGDGSGKQTQTKLLVDYLREIGHRVETIDFPQYDTFSGRIIRAYLDGQFGDPTKIDPELAAMPYTMNRMETAERIRQFLLEGKTVILDRYHSANLIHQGAKLPAENLESFVFDQEALEFQHFNIPAPDQVLYLHVTPEAAQRLMEAQGRVKDGHEADIKYAKRVERTALQVADILNWVVIECCPNGSILSIEEIQKAIRREVEKIISEAKEKEPS